MLDVKELEAKLTEFRRLPVETEWLEFKEAKNSYDFDDLGQYFSALSNEANLKHQPSGWLIFGVKNKIPRTIVGTAFRRDKRNLESLKHEVAKHTNGITFQDIHELDLPEVRVLMFQIPPAPAGIPTGWKGHFYGRDGESLVALSIQEFETIRGQAATRDWSAEICPKATINDLDAEAILKAREQFRIKHPNQAEQSDAWDPATFLNKAKLTIQGSVTNTAILLLGRAESAALLSPAAAEISWMLKDDQNRELDYKHFGPPFIFQVDQVLQRIRNLTLRTLPSGTLFPQEISQYDPWVIREALHNSIAHQDYHLHGRIQIIEKPSSILLTNLGSFLPGSVERVIQQDAPLEIYRNRFLAEAMVNLNMIDTQGGGIKRMFRKQMSRFFPLPDYDLSEPNRVAVTIRGEILDEQYSRLLMERTDLDLGQVMLLDKVQKGIRISREDHRILKKARLVEGRYPRLFITARIAQATDTKADYTKHRAVDKKKCKALILEFLDQHGAARPRDFQRVLMDVLSDLLTEGQKKVKIANLLQEMSREGLVQNTGARGRQARWVRLD